MLGHEPRTGTPRAPCDEERARQANTANQRPSATRSARSAPSSTSAGRVKAQPPTRSPGADEEASPQRVLEPLVGRSEPERDDDRPATTPARDCVRRIATVPP